LVKVIRRYTLLKLLLALLLAVSFTSCTQTNVSLEPPQEMPLPPPLIFVFQTTPPTRGSGVAGDPWQLSTPEQLAWMADPDYSERLTGHFLLLNDITAPDNLIIAHHTLEELEDASTRNTSGFRGSFDGGNHTIAINIYLPNQHVVGLFGHIGASGHITNLAVSGRVNGASVVGGLAGFNDGEVVNCSANVEVVGQSQVGGLIGGSANSVQNSYANGNVSSVAVAGGLVGVNSGDIISSHANGDIKSGSGSTGGLIGANSGNVISSHASGNVKSSSGSAGGLIGANSSIFGEPRIIHSYATGDVSGYIMVGGLVGSNHGTIHNSYATGNATGYNAVGGLVGTSGSVGTVSRSYASGNVDSQGAVGGLIGWNESTIQDSYATGNVSGLRWVGGLIAENRGIVQNTYATGNVSSEGEHGVGGLFGRNAYGDEVSSSVAINTIINGPYEAIGRIWGFCYVFRWDSPRESNNNHASSDMHINGQPFTGASTHDDQHGQTVTLEELATETFWRETMGWDFDEIWIWDSERSLPTLRGLPGAEIPLAYDYDAYSDEEA